MVVGVSSDDPDAIDFIDAYVPPRQDAAYAVPDSGKLVLADKDIDNFIHLASERGFRIEEVE
jgi:hypothetical protein